MEKKAAFPADGYFLLCYVFISKNNLTLKFAYFLILFFFEFKMLKIGGLYSWHSLVDSVVVTYALRRPLKTCILRKNAIFSFRVETHYFTLLTRVVGKKFVVLQAHVDIHSGGK